MSDEIETKTITARFLERVEVGDIVVNADRGTPFVPRFRVMAVSHSTVRLAGINRRLNFIVRVSDKARRSFKRTD